MQVLPNHKGNDRCQQWRNHRGRGRPASLAS